MKEVAAIRKRGRVSGGRGCGGGREGDGIGREGL